MEWTRDLWNISYPSLTTLTPFKSQKILFNDRAMGSNLLQPKGDLLLLEPVKPALPSYTIYSLRAASRSGVLARLVSLAQIGELARRLHYLLKFSPSFYPRHFMDLLQPPPPLPPYRASRCRIAGKCSTLAWMGWMHEKNTFENEEMIVAVNAIYAYELKSADLRIYIFSSQMRLLLEVGPWLAPFRVVAREKEHGSHVHEASVLARTFCSLYMSVCTLYTPVYSR